MSTTIEGIKSYTIPETAEALTSVKTEPTKRLKVG